MRLPLLFSFLMLHFTLISQNTSPFSIDELERRTFNFFWETPGANAQTPDRWPNETFSSIAATGFGLSSYLVGVERGYITRAQAAERTLVCLQFLKNLPQSAESTGIGGFHGFFYHFLENKTGHRYKDVELSTIDTGLLMAGILSAQTYFDAENATETNIRQLAEALYTQVEWDWMLNSNYRISMGWKPETGFIAAEWAGYNEASILYFLAIGSPTHPIAMRSWQAWASTYLVDSFQNEQNIQFGPLFGHQYSQVWVDFRGVNDAVTAVRGWDYFENSRRATLANRRFCANNQEKFPHFSKKIWGLTACDGPADWFGKQNPSSKCANQSNFLGYSARGAAADYLENDGTIAPTAAGGSIPFAPEICIEALDAMWTDYGDSLVGKYGFKDAFNPSFTACGQLPNGWFDADYLGIDQGPILLMLENWRSGFLWNLMKRNPHLVRGMKKAGFRGGWLNEAEPKVIKLGTSTRVNKDIPLDLRWNFSKNTFRESGKTNATPLPYRLLKPDYSGQKLPLVVFLHGSGERGINNEAQLSNGVLRFADPIFQAKNPCFVLVPQCPTTDNWGGISFDWQKMGFDETHSAGAQTALLTLIDQLLLENKSIDTNRIYLTGLSMGGYGTYDLLTRRPQFFAAAMPLCSGGDPLFASRIARIPMRVFHGKLDNIVPAQLDRDMVFALKNAGSSVEYTEFDDLGHDIWNRVYDNLDNLEWLFTQKRKPF